MALTLTPAAALAHHGWSAYTDKPQKLTGVVREVQFAKPHATIQTSPSPPEDPDVWEAHFLLFDPRA